jgi:hypothetical protein
MPLPTASCAPREGWSAQSDRTDYGTLGNRQPLPYRTQRESVQQFWIGRATALDFQSTGLLDTPIYRMDKLQ